MTFNDPIAEFLTKLRNAKLARHRYVDIRLSKIKLRLAEILKKEGFVENFLLNQEKRKMRIFLRYAKGRQSVIHGLKRVSVPSHRKYVGFKEIPKVFNGLGIAILSTPKGILVGKEAQESKVGGELLCYVW
jgi:small subunit ribosomal protein S8